MTNYFDSPFKGKLLSEQVKNPNMPKILLFQRSCLISRVIFSTI